MFTSFFLYFLSTLPFLPFSLPFSPFSFLFFFSFLFSLPFLINFEISSLSWFLPPSGGPGGAKVGLYSPGKHTNKNNHLFLNSLLVPWDGWLGIQYRFFFLSKSLTWIHIKFFVKLYTYLYKIVHIQNIQHDTLNCLYEKINNKNILS